MVIFTSNFWMSLLTYEASWLVLLCSPISVIGNKRFFTWPIFFELKNKPVTWGMLGSVYRCSVTPWRLSCPFEFNGSWHGIQWSANFPLDFRSSFPGFIMPVIPPRVCEQCYTTATSSARAFQLRTQRPKAFAISCLHSSSGVDNLDLTLFRSAFYY